VAPAGTLNPNAPGHHLQPSVDHGLVIDALENLGFHATDAPGGSFFYVRVGFDGYEVS